MKNSQKSQNLRKLADEYNLACRSRAITSVCEYIEKQALHQAKSGYYNSKIYLTSIVEFCKLVNSFDELNLLLNEVVTTLSDQYAISYNIIDQDQRNNYVYITW